MDALIVCTRNRPDDLLSCLVSVASSIDPPDIVVVVDSSDPPAAKRNRQAIDELGEGAPDIKWLVAAHAPGLTRQRNAGLALVTDVDIVHFLDDDAIPSPGYFRAIRQAFADESVVGAGGNVTNYLPRPARTLDRFFLLDSRRRGKVLRSGVNTMPGPVREDVEVDWLSGCAMSYRLPALAGVWFDASLTGYSSGEDVDFSVRCRSRGRLMVVADAEVVHNYSPAGHRPDGAAFIAGELRNRYRRLDNGQEFGQPLWFWWSALGLGLKGLVGSCAGRPSSRASLQGLLAFLRDR